MNKITKFALIGVVLLALTLVGIRYAVNSFFEKSRAILYIAQDLGYQVVEDQTESEGFLSFKSDKIHLKYFPETQGYPELILKNYTEALTFENASEGVITYQLTFESEQIGNVNLKADLKNEESLKIQKLLVLGEKLNLAPFAAQKAKGILAVYAVGAKSDINAKVDLVNVESPDRVSGTINATGQLILPKMQSVLGSENVDVKFQTDVGDKKALVKTFDLTSPGAQVVGKGKVDLLNPIKSSLVDIHFEMTMSDQLKQLLMMFLPVSKDNKIGFAMTGTLGAPHVGYKPADNPNPTPRLNPPKAKPKKKKKSGSVTPSSKSKKRYSQRKSTRPKKVAKRAPQKKKFVENFQEPGFERQGTRVVYTKNYKKELMNNRLPELLSSVRLVPNMGKGTNVNGFRITSIKSGSIYEKLGLMNEDVLLSVNGQSLANPNKSIELIAKLQMEKSWNAVVLRDGKQLNFEFTER